MKTIEDVDNFILRWNNKFPLDRWWRQKHGVAFMSPEHQKISFIDQLIEYREDLLFNKIRKEDSEEDEDKYIPNIGEWLKRDFKENSITDFDIEEFRKEAEQLRREGNG